VVWPDIFQISKTKFPFQISKIFSKTKSPPRAVRSLLQNLFLFWISWLKLNFASTNQSATVVTSEMTRKYQSDSLFGWLVPGGWCWFVLRERYRRLVADKPSEQCVNFSLFFIIA
jgi:hypothetical protein